MGKKYEWYFIPTRVINEFKDRIDCNLTTPIIRRKLSAMIYATMKNRIEIGNDVFTHKFGNMEIIVEEKVKVIKEVKYVISVSHGEQEGHYYNILCKRFGLNDAHNAFSLLGCR